MSDSQELSISIPENLKDLQHLALKYEKIR